MRHPYWRGPGQCSLAAQEERVDLLEALCAPPRVDYHCASRGPPREGCGGVKAGVRALGASSRGAVCRSARLALSPGRAGPYRLSALAAGVGNLKGFRWRRRPVLKHTHADATGRSGTFRHAARTVRRDGPSAPAGPRPAARARRGACGSCFGSIFEIEYSRLYLPVLFRLYIRRVIRQALSANLR